MKDPKTCCLYCGRNEGILLLSREINALIHEKCLKEELLKLQQKISKNHETIVVGREFGLCH